MRSYLYRYITVALFLFIYCWIRGRGDPKLLIRVSLVNMSWSWGAQAVIQNLQEDLPEGNTKLTPIVVYAASHFSQSVSCSVLFTENMTKWDTPVLPQPSTAIFNNFSDCAKRVDSSLNPINCVIGVALYDQLS